MKTLRFLSMAFAILLSSALFAQKFSTLPKAEREKQLIELAQRVYKNEKYKAFYREFGNPVISEQRAIKVEQVLRNDPLKDLQEGDLFYKVTFLYDTEKELMEQGFAAQIYIVDKTGKPVLIKLGNMMGYPVKEGDY